VFVSLQAALDRYLPQIEAELQSIVCVPHHSLAAYYGLLYYHLGWADEELKPIDAVTGKRLRPLLCLLSCQAAGGYPQQALPAACAVELVHNFSLVHDDIQDSSRYRRGRRTVWDIWGAAHAINVGDGLFALAHLALHRLDNYDVPLSRQQLAAAVLDRACVSLCEGQYFDMTFEQHVDVNLDQYLGMIRLKTAALLAASTQLGAIVATGDDHSVAHYDSFGENLGMAFQIQDDILGVWGDPRVSGKSAATDIRSKKKALPAVLALNQSDDPEAAQRLAELYALAGPLEEPAIQDALAILDRVGARPRAEEMARTYYRQALQSLDDAGVENAAGSQLRELAASLLGRSV
jgi:geranylgeranyl diphosphate synthase type I